MRIIVTHKTRTAHEIALLVLEKKNFTAPLGLPHYRYDRTRHNVHRLVEGGLLKSNGKDGIQRFFVSGNNMQRWVDEGKPNALDFCNRIRKERKADKKQFLQESPACK